MTPVRMFEQLCAINNTIERLSQAQTDGPMQVALEAIVQTLDGVIDEGVAAEIIEPDESEAV